MRAAATMAPEPVARNRVATPIDGHRRPALVRHGHATRRRVEHGLGGSIRIRFIEHDGQPRRCVHDHFGNPSASQKSSGS
jgi:hypothetical protein